MYKLNWLNMMIKVLMLPHVSEVQNQSNGIARVIEGYFKHLPDFDIELVEPDVTSYDLAASHAGITGGDCDIAHLHGLYWTGDYNASEWEWHVNSRVIEACRKAKQITVPSAWVGETIQRDMRLTPAIIPHGINWQEWQHNEENRGYVLWNKNRNFDVCDNSILDILIDRFPDVQFVSTLPTVQNQGYINSPMWPGNFRILPSGAKTKHDEMKGFVQRCGVYLSVAKETFSVGNLEAMASGKPILGWDWGGNSFLIRHGITGYLAKVNDIDDLMEGLNYCLKYAKILGANAREIVKEYTWQKSCEKVAEVYRLAVKDDTRPMNIDPSLYELSNGNFDKVELSLKV